MQERLILKIESRERPEKIYSLTHHGLRRRDSIFIFCLSMKDLLQSTYYYQVQLVLSLQWLVTVESSPPAPIGF